MTDHSWTVASWMARELNISGTALNLFAYIHSFTVRCGSCYASTETMARDMGVHRNSVTSALKRLEKAGHICTKGRHSSGTTIYVSTCTKTVQPMHKNCADGCTKTVHNNKPYNTNKELPIHFFSDYDDRNA